MSESIEKKKVSFKKPKWLRVKLPIGPEYKKVRKLVEDNNLNTICQSGNCPNMGECWGAGTATFMILGNTCTRSCGFCAVSTGKGDDLDEFEPAKVARSIKTMEIKHAVITSVDRDDLADGGEAEVLSQPIVLEQADQIKLTGAVKILISLMEITV